ncbi:MAG: arsenite methyltransferase [Bacteroidales bacterium]|jgi:arsenite methyltransferase|nr:arsenite methyltransferase [Bacteroidales bacterium]
MKVKKNIKDIVKEKYGRIASQSKQQNLPAGRQGETSCCGSTGCCEDVDYTVFSEDYSHLEGYNKDADLGLGCGLPTEFAKIKTGDTVLDLGSGAGNDCFVARASTGEKGKVIGIDFSDEMLKKANENLTKLTYKNIEFVKGDIEEMPIESSSVNVVVSNCVLNLVPDKKKAFNEIYRVLKNDAHFSVSDVVLMGELPDRLKESAEMYAGCVSGAIQKDEYLKIIRNSGFTNIEVQKERVIEIPDDILLNVLNEQELIDYKDSNLGIFSINVFAKK